MKLRVLQAILAQVMPKELNQQLRLSQNMFNILSFTYVILIARQLHLTVCAFDALTTLMS